MNSPQEIARAVQDKLQSARALGAQSFSSVEKLYDSRSLVEEVLDEHLSSTETSMRERMIDEFFGEGPLTDLLQDDSITEIIVTRFDQIWIERLGRFSKCSDSFLTMSTFQNFVMRLCLEAKVQLNLENPMINGHWRGLRINLTDASLTNSGTQLSLRKHPSNPWTFDRLAKNGWGSDLEIAKLKEIVQARKNIMVIGPTGSGKTSIMNACLQSLAPEERLVVIEDCDEIKVPSPASSKLLTRPSSASGTLKEVTQAHLVKQSLRMRPDRLILGEVRGEEAKDFLMALSTGHEGSFGSLHASNPKQALLRLEMLIQLGAPQWKIEAVRNLIHLSLDYILLATRCPRGQRKFGGLYRISSLESTGFLLERVELGTSSLGAFKGLNF